jgi:Flp pilus assembly protein TadG
MVAARKSILRGFRRPRRRGSATLEFALALPILLSVVLLCVDFGQMAYYYIGVTNAARAGAAYASVNIYSTGTQTAWQNNVIQAVRDEFANNGWYDSSKLTVDTPTRTTVDTDHWYVTVTVHYSYRTLINWTGITGYHNSVTLTRTVVMPWHL